MRKQLIGEHSEKSPPPANWLNVEELAQVEITSEDPAYPIEFALRSDEHAGWRAAAPGSQTVRLIFDRPQSMSCIALQFREHEVVRTQEYVLRWSDDAGKSFHEIARQQWNFSPAGSTVESEEHRIALPAVTMLELMVTPDISRSDTRASLAALRVAA